MEHGGAFFCCWYQWLWDLLSSKHQIPQTTDIRIIFISSFSLTLNHLTLNTQVLSVKCEVFIGCLILYEKIIPLPIAISQGRIYIYLFCEAVAQSRVCHFRILFRLCSSQI